MKQFEVYFIENGKPMKMLVFAASRMKARLLVSKSYGHEVTGCKSVSSLHY